MGLVACSTNAPPTTAPRPTAERTDPFLVDPLVGFPLAVDAERSQRLRDAYRLLRTGGDRSVVIGTADALLQEDPGLAPARVLRAQLSMLEGEPGAALDRLEPVAGRFPQYQAAQRVRGEAALATGDIVLAGEAFAAIAMQDPHSAQRLEEITPRAVDILMTRIDGALAAGHVEQGRAALDRLQAWAPDDPRLAEATWWVAVAEGDVLAEREALASLLTYEPDRRDALERLAMLDVEAGDIQSGIERYERLAVQYPDDPALVEQIARARFRWRLQNLPDDVRRLANAVELSRADFAALLYWLVPEVRYTPLTDPPIATDILDHARRNEIVRVANLDLLMVDETVHLFHPARPVLRRQVLGALMTLVQRSQPPRACLADAATVSLASPRAPVCAVAARCGLLNEPAACLPSARVAGGEAMELFRKTLDLLAG